MTVSRIAASLAAGAIATLAVTAQAASPADTRNVVIVPGAFVDGSGWHVVHDILAHKGYHVTVVQTPHASLDEDVAATRKILFQQFGKVVLVGNGVGGTVISNVGTGDKVKALVYVAALVPEVGETSGLLAASVPAASSAASPIQTDFSGYQFFRRDRFHDDFAADLTVNRSDFMAASQVPLSQVFMGTPSWFAVWHKKPSYAVLATEDRLLAPELQRRMYQRAKAKVTEIKASHAVHISQPEEVARVIEQAAIENL